MSTIVSQLIPLICGLYFLLLLKGVIKLSPARQVKFDDRMRDKKKFMVLLCSLLIAISIAFIVKELFFPKTV